MNTIDYIIIAVLAAWLVFALLSIRKRKKKGGCSCCSGCNVCYSSRKSHSAQ